MENKTHTNQTWYKMKLFISINLNNLLCTDIDLATNTIPRSNISNFEINQKVAKSNISDSTIEDRPIISILRQLNIAIQYWFLIRCTGQWCDPELSRYYTGCKRIDKTVERVIKNPSLSNVARYSWLILSTILKCLFD